jgi:hypothetical protein
VIRSIPWGLIPTSTDDATGRRLMTFRL